MPSGPRHRSQRSPETTRSRSLPAHPRRLSGYSVARNDLHRAGGGNFDRPPITSTRVATEARRRGEASSEIGGPDRCRPDSWRSPDACGAPFPTSSGTHAGRGSRLFPTARTAVGTDSSPEHVLDQYWDAFEVAIGTGSIRGSERLWGPRLDWRCSMRPTCGRTIYSSRSTSTARMTERGPPARSDPLERTASEGTVSVTQERAAQWTEAAIG